MVSSDFVNKLEDTESWCRLKQMLSIIILSEENDTDKQAFVKFMAKHWSGHAPREIELLRVAQLEKEIETLRNLLAVPTRRRHAGPHSHMVVICREGDTQATLFDDLRSAHEFHGSAGAQWSESYLTEILRGPLV